MDGEGGDEAGVPGIGDGGRGGGAGSGICHGDRGGIVRGGVGRLVCMQGEYTQTVKLPQPCLPENIYRGTWHAQPSACGDDGVQTNRV